MSFTPTLQCFHPRLRALRLPLVLAAALWLAGCDQLGIESATAINARSEAEGRAIGGGCRHAARSIEECYQQNRRANKAAVFAGWREMEDYMRENSIQAVPAAAADPESSAAAEPGKAKVQADAAGAEGSRSKAGS